MHSLPDSIMQIILDFYACILVTLVLAPKGSFQLQTLDVILAGFHIRALKFGIKFQLKFQLNLLNVFQLAQIKEMPRKPTRCRPSPRPLPFTFSPFFRTVAQVASYCKANHQIHESKFHKKSPPNAAGIIILLNFSSMNIPLCFLLFFPWSLGGF